MLSRLWPTLRHLIPLCITNASKAYFFIFLLELLVCYPLIHYTNAYSYNEIPENSGSGVAQNDSTMLKFLDKYTQPTLKWVLLNYLVSVSYSWSQLLYKKQDIEPTLIFFLISHQFPSLFLSSLLDTPCIYLGKYWRVRYLWWQAKYWAGTYSHYILFTKNIDLGTSKISINSNEIFWIHSTKVLCEKGLNS